MHSARRTPKSHQPECPAEPSQSSASTRRQWFMRASASLLAITNGALSARAGDGPATTKSADPTTPDTNKSVANRQLEAQEIAAVQAKATGAGVGSLGSNRSDHFLAIGNAPEAFRREALDICEKLSEAFLSDLTKRGFTLERANRRLSVVTLKDAQAYAWYNGDVELPTDEGGHYEVDTNRLVVFVFRPRNQDVEADASRANLFSLVHEATHQLCFNTGLLSRQSDFPECISEGLATYAETWRRRDKTKLNGINPFRLQVLRQSPEWIPIAKLFTNDELFNKPETQQLAYAESWLLVHYLMRADNVPKFRDYLAKLRKNADPTKRQPLAESALGPLAKLDKSLRTYASKLKPR